MGTFWHYLRTQTGNRSPKRLMFVDVEPYAAPLPGWFLGCEHTFRCGHATYVHVRSGRAPARKELAFDNPGTFWTWLDNHSNGREALWLFAHNAGYDLTLLGFWDLLIHKRYDLLSFVISDPPTSIAIRTPRGLVRIVDTRNYWDTTMDEILKCVHPGEQSERQSITTDKRPQDKCRGDCLAIEQLVCNLVEWCEPICNFAPTSAGLAWSAYRRSFLKSNKRILIHADAKATFLERASYVGGNCSVNRLGRIDGGVSQLDCNSLYPSVMRSMHYPVKLSVAGECPSLYDLQKQMERGGVIALVRISANHRQYHIKVQGKTTRVAGRFYAVLCGRELSMAISSGDVRKCWAFAAYETADIFSEYVDYFYGQRLKARDRSDKLSEACIKLFLNSLYGKFGQRSPSWEDARGIVPPCAYGLFLEYDGAAEKVATCRSIAYKVQRQIERGEWTHSFPAISAFVTANAREHMFQASHCLPAYSVYYEDTDCFHVSPAGREAFERAGHVNERALGAFKVKASCDQARYYGVRDYQFGSTKTISGIMTDAREISDGCFLQDHQQGLEQLLAREPGNTVPVLPRSIRMQRDTSKHQVDAEGWVSPVVLDEWKNEADEPGTLDLFRNL